MACEKVLFTSREAVEFLNKKGGYIYQNPPHKTYALTISKRFSDK